MKKLTLIAFLFLAACQPADQGPKPTNDGRQAQSEKPETPLPLTLIMSQASDLGMPNQIAVTTKNITSVERIYSFQTDAIFRFILTTDLRGVNCLDATSALDFWAMQPKNSVRLPINSVITLKPNEPYQLKVNIRNVHCDSVDLRFGFRRAE